MRDDTITFAGPFEVEPLDVPEHTDEDGNVVPEHTVDMSHLRRLEFKSRACPCERLHGYTVLLQWEMILGWREFAEHALEAAMRTLLQSIEDCQAVEAIAKETGR